MAESLVTEVDVQRLLLSNGPLAEALIGTSGTPGPTNKYVTNADPRNTDARAPAAHGHAESDVTALVSDLAGKAASSHGHAESDVTGLVADLAAKAAVSHAHAPADVTGTAVVTNDSRLSDARTPTAHSHAPADVTGTAVITTDSRLSDARTPTAHNHVATEVTSGTFDGDRLPALSATKAGGAPATGTPAGKFLRDDATWQAVGGGSTPTGTGFRHVTAGSEDVAAKLVDTVDINDDQVTYAKFQNVTATGRLLGRITTGAGNAEELTGTQATTLFDVFTSTLKGMAPSSGGGTTNFLRADGTWAAPAGGGGLGYVLPVGAASQATTTDAQTLYWGGMLVAPSATAARWRVYIPKAGTITAAYIYSYAGTAGTAEAWVMNIRKNNTTDTQIASVALATVDRVWSNVALNISVVAGDYIEIKEVCPTWATNPAAVTRTGVIYIG